MTLNPETGLYEAYEFVYDPLWLQPWFIGAAVSLIILLLIGIMYLAYRLIQSYNASNILPITKAETALHALEKQIQQNKEPQNMSKIYEIIVQTIKQYSSATSGHTMAHYTPHEFSYVLQHVCNSSNLKNEISQFFELMELKLFSNTTSKKEEVLEMISKTIILLKKIDSRSKK